MAFYSGSSGDLLIDGQRAARVRNWSISASVGMLETTSLGQTDRTVTPGIRTTTGSCQLFYYTSNPNTKAGNSASVLLNKLIKERTTADPGVAAETQPVTLKLRVNDGTNDGKFIELECYLTSVGMAMSVGEVLSADVAFEANGAPLMVDI